MSIGLNLGLTLGGRRRGAASPAAPGEPTNGSEPHRYWRIFVETNNGHENAVAILELELRETEFGPNLAAGGAASASSSVTGAAASQAFSGNLDDRDGNYAGWAGSSEDNEYLAYDFGAGNAKAVNAIGIRGRRAAFVNQMPKDFQIEWSDNGTDWTLAWRPPAQTDWTNFDHRTFVNPGYSEPSYTGSPRGDFDRFRLYTFAINGSTVVAVSNVEVRATPGGADQTSGGTASAQSTFSGTSAANAFNGNTGNFWASNADVPQWLQYVFSGAVEISEVAVTSRADGFASQAPNHFAVMLGDGTVWTHGWDVTEQSGWGTPETRVFTDPAWVDPS
jgi:hypothetical protein